MVKMRCWRTMTQWIDIDVEDDETEMDAMDLAIHCDDCQWDEEILDSGVDIIEEPK